MWSDNMQMALFAIRGNKLRSFLTMLGIVIGIGSVIAILSIGDTMKMAFEALYEGEGATRAMLYVVPGKAIEPDVFTLDDLETVRRVFDESIAYLDSYATLTAQASHLAGSGKKREAQLYLQGIDGDYGEAMPLDIVDGRSLREGDVLGRYAHLVLEEKGAKELFGDAAAVGNVVLLDIGGAMEEFTVVGVYRARQTPLETALAGGGGTRRGFIPYTLLTKPGDSFEMIQFFGKPGTDMGSLGASLVNYLEKRKKIPEGSLSVMSAQEEMETWDTALAGMSAAVGGIAAISLLVGGIGIMNIMLVSVTQRTREIGIRKALGAKPGDLLVQFLTESAVLSGMGGVMGVCLGVGIAWVGGALVHMEAVVRPGVVLAAVGFSAGVGAFFGLYPAMQAAKSDPIEALRYE